MELEAHFQAKCVGNFDDETFTEFANDGALALREKIAAGMDFRGANASELTTVEILVTVLVCSPA